MNKEQLDLTRNKIEAKGISLSESTIAAFNDLINPHYTISLAGRFQVGKSTLLNRVMIGNDTLLTEGHGIPTTAIPTKLVYGERKCLTIVYRDSNINSQSYYDNEVNDDLLRSLTTAASADERLELSQRIKYVQLALPLDVLRNYTFFDTPGIDDPDQNLIRNTTATVLPESDLVVFVVSSARTLTLEDLEFLKKSIFNSGMTRIMILVSYNPQVYQDADARRQILANIEAQLRQIGREYVPVYSYTYDADVDGDILRGKDEIMQVLLSFIEENKNQAKIDKANYYLQKDLIRYIETLKAKIEVSGKTEDELKITQGKIDDVARDLDAEYTRIRNDLFTGMNGIKAKVLTGLRKEMIENNDSLLSKFEAKFNNNDLAGVKARVESAIYEITPEIEALVAKYVATMDNDVQVMLTQCSEKIAEAAQRISISTNFAPSVNTGWLGKINPALLKIQTAGGVLVFTGSPITAIIQGLALVFGDKIPILRSLLNTLGPNALVGRGVRQTVVNSFEASLEDVLQDISRQLDDAREALMSGLQEVFEEIFKDQIAPYQKAIAEAGQTRLTEEKISQYTSEIETLKNMLNELNV